MDGDGASQNSTQVLEKSLSPHDHAQKVRDQLEGLGEVWEAMGVSSELKSAIITAASRATLDHLRPQKRTNRRLSVLDRTDVIVGKVKGTIDELNEMWDQIDMDEERRLIRVNTAYAHMEKLLDDMLSSENAMITSIHCEIDEYTEKVAAIRREMGMPPFDFKPHQAGSIALWKALEKDIKKLDEDRAALIDEQKDVLERFARVTSRLGSDCSDETAASIPDTSVLAPRAAVADIRERCVRMEHLLSERVEKVKEVQKEMNEWIQRMKCDYDENVAAILEVDVRAPESALTGDLMEQMAEIRETMYASYSEWLSSREFEYAEHIERLAELWEMCCVQEAERRLPAQFDPTLLDSLEEAASEVARLEGVYETRKAVYEAVAAWKTHWQEKLQFESSENSLDKYTNRGGALDQRIKYENRLNKQLLPQAAHAVSEAYTAFLAAHPDDHIFIEGMEPLAFIRHVTSTHDLEKEMEREQKAQARKAQLENECKWGTTPAGKTPAPKTQLGSRRPLAQTASSTRLAPAAKMPRIGQAGTGGDEMGAANFTFDQSAISSISPKKRADKLFPKTSSPKGSRVTVAPGTRFASPIRNPAATPNKGNAQTPKRPFLSANRK